MTVFVSAVHMVCPVFTFAQRVGQDRIRFSYLRMLRRECEGEVIFGKFVCKFIVELLDPERIVWPQTRVPLPRGAAARPL